NAASVHDAQGAARAVNPVKPSDHTAALVGDATARQNVNAIACRGRCVPCNAASVHDAQGAIVAAVNPVEPADPGATLIGDAATVLQIDAPPGCYVRRDSTGASNRPHIAAARDACPIGVVVGDRNGWIN